MAQLTVVLEVLRRGNLALQNMILEQSEVVFEHFNNFAQGRRRRGISFLNILHLPVEQLTQLLEVVVHVGNSCIGRDAFCVKLERERNLL